MNLNNIEVNPSNEFFIAIGKKGIHSFLMLGVVNDEGEPRLLARIGKTNDIDPDYNNKLRIKLKLLFSSTKAHLGEEKLYIKSEISYQAYSINLNQFNQFLELVHNMEKKHLDDPIIGPKVGETRINCYLPIETTEDKITFKYQPLAELPKFLNTESEIPSPELMKGAQEVRRTNNCRTTSLNIIELILGYKTDVSQYFFVSPKYKTHGQNGHPNKAAFYVLPPPPIAFKSQVSPKQMSVLKKLYARLGETPLTYANDKETKLKFDELRSMYTEISGQNNLSAKELLSRIIQHETGHGPVLFAKRHPNFFSRMFSCISSTERLFKNMKTELAQNADEPGKSPSM